jgi:hypothetical protein
VGDRKVEIIISLKDVLGGGAGNTVWDVASSTSDNCLPWPTGRGNNLRNGQCSEMEAALRHVVPKTANGLFKSSAAVEYTI